MARNNKKFKERMYEIRIKLHDVKKNKDLKIVKTETVEEFLARGGQITYINNSNKDSSSFKSQYINKSLLQESYDYLTDQTNPSEYL